MVKVSKFIMVILLPLIILLGTVNLVASNDNAYMKGYEKYNIDEVTGIETGDLQRITDNFIRYFYKPDAELQIEAKVHGSNRAVFNEKEILHMIDVKNLVKLSLIVLGSSAALMLVASLYVLTKQGVSGVLKTYGLSSGITLVSIPVLYLVLPKNFLQLFIKFHEILFTNDLWLLDEKTDILLQLHPLGFFQDMAILIGVIFAVVMVLFLLIGIISAIKKKKRAKPTWHFSKDLGL